MSVSVNITRSVDIEDEVRNALKSYMTAYCRPLPADFTTPSVLITLVGGSDANQIDTFDVTLTANETLRNAIGLMRKAAKEQTTAIRHIEVNSSGSWGSDPVRPDLSMYSARISVVAHLENKTITY